MSDQFAVNFLCLLALVQLLRSNDLGRHSLLYIKEIGHGWFGKVNPVYLFIPHRQMSYACACTDQTFSLALSLVWFGPEDVKMLSRYNTLLILRSSSTLDVGTLIVLLSCKVQKPFTSVVNKNNCLFLSHFLFLSALSFCNTHIHTLTQPQLPQLSIQWVCPSVCLSLCGCMFNQSSCGLVSCASVSFRASFCTIPGLDLNPFLGFVCVDYLYSIAFLFAHFLPVCIYLYLSVTRNCVCCPLSPCLYLYVLSFLCASVYVCVCMCIVYMCMYVGLLSFTDIVGGGPLGSQQYPGGC